MVSGVLIVVSTRDVGVVRVSMGVVVMEGVSTGGVVGIGGVVTVGVAIGGATKSRGLASAKSMAQSISIIHKVSFSLTMSACSISHRASATRLCNSAYENINAEVVNVAKLKQQRQSIAEKVQTLSKLDEEMLDLVEEEALEVARRIFGILLVRCGPPPSVSSIAVVSPSGQWFCYKATPAILSSLSESKGPCKVSSWSSRQLLFHS